MNTGRPASPRSSAASRSPPPSSAFYGLRISRTTGDFYVASRTVRPWWNASAIGGEYLSAASFLGVAGLILVSGIGRAVVPRRLHRRLPDAAAVRRRAAAPLRRLHHPRLRRGRGSIDRPSARVTSLLVVVVGWLYIVPQLHGAGADHPHRHRRCRRWVGAVVVVVVVCVTVVAGGMRSITFVQAFQYWLKLTALAVPVVFILLVLAGAGSPAGGGAAFDPALASRRASLYRNISLIVALLFGTLGLPHVLVRFYTNPDGAAARRTTLMVLGLLCAVLPLPHGSTACSAGCFAPACGRRPGRRHGAAAARADVGGLAGDLLSALVVAGAFAAFLSTTSGPGGVAGRRDQPGPVRRQRRGFRLAARRCPPWSRWALPWTPNRWPWPAAWAWCSPSRHRQSARCCCWASGGAG